MICDLQGIDPGIPAMLSECSTSELYNSTTIEKPINYFV